MVSCGGQATIPMVAAVEPRAAGGVRRDRRHRRLEVGRARARARTSTSSRARRRSGIEKVGGAKRGKAIIILNPAEPPLIMRDTVHCLTDDEPDQATITASVHAMIARGAEATFRATRSRTARCSTASASPSIIEVEGLGDYLPKYAGNLDIMTAAALRTGEMFAEEMPRGRFMPQPTAA